MIKRIGFLFTIAAFAVTSSCKKGEITPTTEIEKEAHSAVAVPITDEQIRATPTDGKYPVLTFSEPVHDFGSINATDKVMHTFKFENTGEADLIISKATGSCGCTVPEFPKDPIKPGQTAEIKVSFDPTNKKGLQNKTVSIYTNTAGGLEKLTVKASIEDGTKPNS